MNTKKIVKNESNITEKNINELHKFIINKINEIQEIIRNTIISIKNNMKYEIFSNNDMNISINLLNELYEKTNEILSKTNNTNSNKEYDTLIELLQKIIDKLSMIMCGFGTKNIDDLLFICFGTEFKNIKIDNEIFISKYELIKKYIHPIGYKIIKWKQIKDKKVFKYDKICISKISDDINILEDANNFECFDIESSNKNFHQKIYGIRVVIQNENLNKTIVINGLIDDIQINCFNNKYIDKRKEELKKKSNELRANEKEVLLKIIDSLTIKDILIYSNDDIIKKMNSVFIEVNNVKSLKIDAVINKFMALDLISQRNMLINLLLYIKDDDIQYICYLLYDLTTVNSIDTNDGNEQKNIYESLPYNIKKCFKDFINCNIKITNDNTQKYENIKISYEQQIHLLKANDVVKEKAMTKLKEIKNKSDENCSKAKQYLEGLLKIPFGIYREEPILRKLKDYSKLFENILPIISTSFPELQITKKIRYNTIEILEYINLFENYICKNYFHIVETLLNNQKMKHITQFLQYINANINNNEKIVSKNMTKNTLIKNILNFLKNNKEINDTIIFEIYKNIYSENQNSISKILVKTSSLKSNIISIETSMQNINNILDESIYGHNNAKNQVMKIIGQWMTGEQNGYCFGFEGSPGVGKTSLAKKGLANCLKSSENQSRPFAFIALGGSCNGSYLEGHGYTYLNSNWGRITEILMQTKCMNPIIYIDELDKVSKTENGKEIIGILTHIIDQTQNDVFQDKYFSGIDIDLSKALFIFSYNDPENIDHILLDRIHRIKFDNLTLIEKVVIVKKYILPEINKKMGFHGVVELTDEIIKHIIKTYTLEPGVRKLKELLFDLYGEINLEIIKYNPNEKYILPVVIDKEKLEKKYLKKYKKIKIKTIHKYPEIGIINGLWANALGTGGIIPIQVCYYPSSVFLDLKLTGLQGDVMKESMNVAKTLAWNLTDDDNKKMLIKQFEETKCQGMHIHCPEGAVSKDGPSAGTAITTAIYSLFNNKMIKNNVAITGEITLQGNVTEIGGLDMKINGGIDAGVKTFLYPKENQKDFLEWKKKTNTNIEGIEFIEISTIQDVFKHVFV
jgi:hypothetical protein